MKFFPRLLALLLTLLPCLLPVRAHAFGWPNSNDSIFPPLPAAYKGNQIRLQMAFAYNPADKPK